MPTLFFLAFWLFLNIFNTLFNPSLNGNHFVAFSKVGCADTHWHRVALWDSGRVGFAAQTLLSIDLHEDVLFTAVLKRCGLGNAV